MITTPDGLPIARTLTNPSADEREVLRDMLARIKPTSDQTLMADKGYRSKQLERPCRRWADPAAPRARNESPRPGARLLRPLRQRIESVFDTLKDQLGLERHGARTANGVTARVAQRILALTTTIWPGHLIGAPTLRTLTPYDH